MFTRGSPVEPTSISVQSFICIRMSQHSLAQKLKLLGYRIKYAVIGKFWSRNSWRSLKAHPRINGLFVFKSANPAIYYFDDPVNGDWDGELMEGEWESSMPIRMNCESEKATMLQWCN